MLRSLFVLPFCGLFLLTACPVPDGMIEPDDAGTPSPSANPCDLMSDCPDDGRPPLRTEMMGIWDEAQNRMILFGGNSAISEQCAFATPSVNDFHGDTWAYHAKCGTWENLGTDNGPSPRARYMMAKDDAGNRVLLFGGRFRQTTSGNYRTFNDLWSFDLATNTWSEIVTTNAPMPRVNSGFAINPEGTKAYLFGGSLSLSGASYNAQNDLWELDLATNTWTELVIAGAKPSERLFVAMTFDPGRNRLVMTGGGDNSAFFDDAQYFDDVWGYNIADNTWDLLAIGGNSAPEGRFWGGLVYDQENDVFLSFGGHDDAALGNSNDLWSFDPSNNSWSLLRIGDTYNRPANGLCDFPADFTIVDEEAPERRNAHAMVYATGECPSLIVAMGKTDCGAVDDVFRWVTNDAKWEEIQTASRGEVCLRGDSEFDCTEMCN